MEGRVGFWRRAAIALVAMGVLVSASGCGTIMSLAGASMSDTRSEKEAFAIAGAVIGVGVELALAALVPPLGGALLCADIAVISGGQGGCHK